MVWYRHAKFHDDWLRISNNIKDITSTILEAIVLVLLTNYLTSWSWDLLEQLPAVQLLKNFPTFYETWRFISTFTRALHWSLSWARSIQLITPNPISLRSSLILSTHLCLGLPSSLLPSGFPTISYIQSFSPHSCCVSYPSHPQWLHHSNYTWQVVEVMKLLIRQFSSMYCDFISLWSKSPLLSETKFHTHTKPHAELEFCIF
jgi:hypothetical protein